MASLIYVVSDHYLTAIAHPPHHANITFSFHPYHSFHYTIMTSSLRHAIITPCFVALSLHPDLPLVFPFRLSSLYTCSSFCFCIIPDSTLVLNTQDNFIYFTTYCYHS